MLIGAVRSHVWSRSLAVRKAAQAGDWRGSFETACCGPAEPSRHRRFSPLHPPARERRPLARSLTSAGRAVKFWDASAILPLLVAENTTRSLQALANRDSDLLVWWGSQVECASALARLERGVLLDVKEAASAFDRLKQRANGWHEIEPSEIIRENALRFLRVHPLGTAAALQLAAAFIAAERRPPSLEVVTLDDRLADAARKEGFELIDLSAV